MGKNNFRRMMMLRDHDKDREPERDRLEEERDRRERELERRLRKLEGGGDRYPYYPQEENRILTGLHILAIIFHSEARRFPDIHQKLLLIIRILPAGTHQQKKGEKNNTQFSHHFPSLRTGNRRRSPRPEKPAAPASKGQ